MKYLNDKEVMQGDSIVAPDGQGGVIVGYIAQIYERDESFIVRGYGPRIKAGTAILAQDAYAVASIAPVAEAP